MIYLFRILLFFSFILSFESLLAGQWELIDKNTLSFEGEITPEEYEAFIPYYDKSINRLILNSGGGETYAALKIANKLISQIDVVIVDGICGSSCANYLFTIGKKKIIKSHSLVGYHGNVTAMMSEWDILESDLINQGISSGQILEIKNYMDMQVEIEREFFLSLGISQELFDRSYQADKGMGDMKSYSLLAPTVESFLLYGIDNIFGEQDIDVANQINSVVD